MSETANGDKISISDITEDDITTVKTICECIKILAEAADAVPEDIVANFAGGKLFTKFKPFAIGGGYIHGEASYTTDLDGFVRFMGSARDAIIAFTRKLGPTYILGKEIQPAIIQEQCDMVKTLCECIKLIGEAAGSVASTITGSFSGAGGGGGANFGLKPFGLGLFGGGGKIGGSFEVAPMIDDFAGFITSSLDALTTFIDSLKGEDGKISIAQESAERALTLCQAVSAIGTAMENVPSKADFDIDFDAIVGGGSIFGSAFGGKIDGKASGSIVPMVTEFKWWIKDVLTALKDFAVGVEDVSLTQEKLDAISALCTSVETLAQAASYAPTNKTIDSWIYDEVTSTDLEGFTDWVTKILPLLTSIAGGTITASDGTAIPITNVKPENIAKLKSVAGAAKVMAEAANMAPTKQEMDSFWSVFHWEEGIETDSTVEWFRNVYNMINGEDGILKDIIANPIDMPALNNLNSLVDVAKKISETLWNISIALDVGNVNTQTFSDVTSALYSFYESLETYIADPNGMDLDVIANAAASLVALKDVIHGLKGFEYDEVDAEGFGTKLTEIVDAIETFSTAFDGLTTDPTDAISQVTSLADMITGLSGLDISGANALKTALENLGKTSIDKLVKAFTDAKGKVIRAINTMVAESAVAVKSSSNITRFYNSGRDLANGLILGINSRKADVYKAAYALGQKAVQGEKDGQKSHSPSKLTIQSGKWFGEGLVIGIEKMTSAVYSSGHNLGQTAVNSVSATISRISDMLDSDMDTQPTIRPVLDLSEVAAGAGTIGSLFNTNPSVGVLSNVGTISTMMNSRQNGNNDDVISAINELGKRIGNASGNTYQINGITYDDGSNISDAVKTIVRAARVERRI